MDNKFLICEKCECCFEVSYGSWATRRYTKKKFNEPILCPEHSPRHNKRPSKSDINNIVCLHCEKSFVKLTAEIKRSKNHFCSRSCSVTYNNTHKTKGTRRSKLEKWLEEQLTNLYPELEILYSNKTTINSELDIYIPSLKLAFELNGIFHYEPIFGKSKLNQIQNNDNRKFQACIENGIELCIIDTSQHKYVKPSTSQKYLDIINNIIRCKYQYGIEPF